MFTLLDRSHHNRNWSWQRPLTSQLSQVKQSSALFDGYIPKLSIADPEDQQVTDNANVRSTSVTLEFPENDRAPVGGFKSVRLSNQYGRV